MGVFDEAFTKTWRKDHITIAVNNAPSVFMENILHVNLDDQKARKMYHRKVINEWFTLLELRGLPVGQGYYNGLNG